MCLRAFPLLGLPIGARVRMRVRVIGVDESIFLLANLLAQEQLPPEAGELAIDLAGLSIGRRSSSRAGGLQTLVKGSGMCDEHDSSFMDRLSW